MRRQAIAVAVLILGLLPLFGAAPARALDPGKSLAACSVDTWRAREGVPGWVRALAQTSEGYLWVGTNVGLVRYGGGRATAIAAAPAQERASDVTGLLAARDGTLWINPGRGDPVCARDGILTDCLPAGQQLAPGTRIADIHQDAQGHFWLAADEGIYRFDGRALTLVHPAARLPFDRATAVHRDARGRLWLGAGNGLFSVAAASGAGAVVPQALIPGVELGFVSSFFETAGGRVWVVSERGLLRIEGEAVTLFGAAEGFPAGRPTQVIEDRDGNVWFGGRRGLTRFRAGAGFVTFTREHGLSDDDVTAVMEDVEGSLWVGTRGGGIGQFTDRTLDAQAGPPSLRERWINTVVEDGAGAIWIGTRAGLTRWKDGQERTFTRADGLPADHVHAVWPGRDGELWVGTEGGLGRWRAGKIDVPAPLATPVSALYQDGQGILWMGIGQGLARLVGGSIERLPVQGGMVLNEIRGMQHDDRGTLWLSAGGKLLRVVNGQVALPPAGSAPFDDVGQVGKVRSLQRSADGTLWLGTYDGLVRNRGGVWRRFDGAQGVVPHDLYQVLDDDRGFLWAGTTQGITRIARAALTNLEAGRDPGMGLVSFHASDQRRAVAAVRANQPGAWKGRDGRLWFATSRGVVTIDPTRLRVNSRPPSVVIEQALVDGRPAKRGVPNAFAPGSGALEFHFAGISLIEPQKVRHRYRLEGFEPQWVEAGTRRVAYYTNIGPGSYRFRVQASNADGVWNHQGDVLELKLAPHFFQTWWFYCLCALGALGLVLSFHRMHVAQVHSRYAATFAERNRVARELHDSLLQGMAAALLHMKGLRKRVARTMVAPPPGQSGQPGDAVTGELQKIEALIASNMEETRQFVFDLREQPATTVAGEQEPTAVALERLVERLRVEGSTEVRLRVEGMARPLPRQVSRELLRIAQEALHNALRHAQAAHVEVYLVEQSDRVQLRVRDDGRGFDPRAAAKAGTGHFGLVGMRERAASIGSFLLESRPGHGTTVEVTISERELTNG
jgi:ligand-binding sensor domain-containing protein/anti-sigma regulatory factor (Ser/Thr protein kinase)